MKQLYDKTSRDGAEKKQNNICECVSFIVRALHKIISIETHTEKEKKKQT